MIRVAKYKRPNGYWYVRYFLAGQRCDESAKTTSDSGAESYRLRRELEINSGIQPLQHAEVWELVSRYLESMPPQTSAKHRQEVNRVLRNFLRICGRKRADGSYRLHSQQVTPEQIDRYVNRRAHARLYDGSRLDARGRQIVRRRPVSNVTLKTELRYLSGFFNWCCRQRPPYLRENPIPLSNAAAIRNDARPHFMITEEEFRILLRACRSPREYLFLLLAWWTGGRRSEILALHYYHFDFAACTVDMSHGKNNMYGRLPLSAEIIDLVKNLYRDAKEADPLFPEDPFVWHGFAQLCRRAGIRHHRFHDFRISTSMRIKSGGFDAGLAGLWVGNQAATNRTYYSDLTGVAMRIGSLLRVDNLPPVPSQSA